MFDAGVKVKLLESQTLEIAERGEMGIGFGEEDGGRPASDVAVTSESELPHEGWDLSLEVYLRNPLRKGVKGGDRNVSEDVLLTRTRPRSCNEGAGFQIFHLGVLFVDVDERDDAFDEFRGQSWRHLGVSGYF